MNSIPQPIQPPTINSQSAIPTQSLPPVNQGVGVFPANQVPRPVTPIGSVSQVRRPWGAIFSILGVTTVFIGLFIIYFLNVANMSKIESLDKSIAEFTERLSSEPLVSTERQVRALATAFNGYKKAILERADFSIVNAEIASLTPKEAILDSLNIDEKGNLRVSASTLTFLDAGRMLLSYQQSQLLKTVTLGSVTFSQKEGQKPISLAILATLDPTLLTKKSPNVSSVNSPLLNLNDPLSNTPITSPTSLNLKP